MSDSSASAQPDSADHDATDHAHPTGAANSWASPTLHPGNQHRHGVARQQIPGSKSITNRALILSALASDSSTINGALLSRDTLLMMQALRALGTTIDIDDTDASGLVRITPGAPSASGTSGESHIADIDCGLAGTVMRFVPPVAGLANGPVHFDGDPHARTRPMSTILDALRSLGVPITGDALPFTVHGQGQPAGGVVDMDASGSSQFVSGLLLAGARYRDGLTVRHTGKNLPSAPHIEMTIDMLREVGVHAEVAPDHRQWSIAPGPIAGHDWVIEPDLSNATPFLAAAAITGSTVRIPFWPQSTTQAGDAIRDILSQMGARVSFTDAGELEVTGPTAGELRGADLDMSDIGELTPTVAAMAALASSPSRLRGIAHLRGHETDRLRALTDEINALGGAVTELSDGLEITPQPLHGGIWHSYADHRMATAGAIIGLLVPGVMVEDIETTAKTLPGFSGMWEDFVAALEESTHG